MSVLHLVISNQDTIHRCGGGLVLADECGVTGDAAQPSLQVNPVVESLRAGKAV